MMPNRATRPGVGLGVIAIAAFLAVEAMALVLVAVRASRLGFDFEAYARAAHRILDGAPLYDLSVRVGDFAAYFYPPPFALAFIPFALLPHDAGLWQWTALAIASVALGVAILPVRPRVRWIVLGLCVINWPVLYSILLSQVGPLLFLLFAVGWHWRNRPVVLGVAIAAGAMMKIQPIILLGWAALTGRWRAVAIAVGAIVTGALISTVALGPGVWSGFIGIVGQVSEPVTTPNSMSLGAIAYQAGISEGIAGTVQIIGVVGVVAVVLVAILKASDEVSYLTTVVASQILSPQVWDHYAVVLILPTAWLMERGHWWGAALMLATSVPLVAFLPVGVYPVVFAVGLVAPLLVEWTERRRAREAELLPADLGGER
jgi:alpha-1,2-mannosyltransferase